MKRPYFIHFSMLHSTLVEYLALNKLEIHIKLNIVSPCFKIKLRCHFSRAFLIFHAELIIPYAVAGIDFDNKN